MAGASRGIHRAIVRCHPHSAISRSNSETQSATRSDLPRYSRQSSGEIVATPLGATSSSAPYHSNQEMIPSPRPIANIASTAMGAWFVAPGPYSGPVRCTISSAASIPSRIPLRSVQVGVLCEDSQRARTTHGNRINGATKKRGPDRGRVLVHRASRTSTDAEAADLGLR